MSYNRLHNSGNPHQGSAKRVLCLCSAGLLRSPTAAQVLSQPPFNHNTRSAGCSTDYALIPVDEVLLHWADEIVVMERRQMWQIDAMLKELCETRSGFSPKPIVCLEIDDNYGFCDPELIKLIKSRYQEKTTLG